MTDVQHITLQLDAFRVPLDVPREKEEVYRQAATMLNARYKVYQRSMPKASVEQLWMYVALEMAVNLHSDARQKAIEPIVEKINELTKHIQQTINPPEHVTI